MLDPKSNPPTLAQVTRQSDVACDTPMPHERQALAVNPQFHGCNTLYISRVAVFKLPLRTFISIKRESLPACVT